MWSFPLVQTGALLVAFLVQTSALSTLSNDRPRAAAGRHARGWDINGGRVAGRHDLKADHAQVPLLPPSNAVSGPAGIGKLPALGWNSWNAYNCDINERHFLDAAQLMIDLGLKDVGYEYVNIDDCWSLQARDNKTGQILPDLAKFPDGINGTAGKIHSLGLKIGIYSSAGTATCAGYPASLGVEDLDAQTWADWGIDYLKYDNCNVPSDWQDICEYCVVDSDNHKDFEPGANGTCPPGAANWCPPDYDFRKSKTFERYSRMQSALQRTGRPILYSLCEWGTANVQQWGAEVGQSWRSTGDIFANWARIKEVLNENSLYLSKLGFYAHSDADMLEVGNLADSATRDAETRSHFALWAAMKSPLLIGTDLSKLNQHDLVVLKNKDLLAFNQDAVHGAPAQPYKWGTNPDWTFDKNRPAEYWSGPSQAGTLVLLLNTDDTASNKTLDYAEVPELKSREAYLVRDAWTGAVLGCMMGPLNVEVLAHDTVALVFGKTCGAEGMIGSSKALQEQFLRLPTI